MNNLRAISYTCLALLAFAANSLFCRMALVNNSIDEWSFTLIRLISGAVVLAAILTWQKSKQSIELDEHEKGSWLSALYLFAYAICFSVAYVRLETGIGALILFSAVQLTMITASVFKKEPFNMVQWIAFFVAFAGFISLVLPSAEVPEMAPAVLMVISGIAWGLYSLQGRGCRSPLAVTSFNFNRSLLLTPLVLLFAPISWSDVSQQGILLAIASGALASGVGYSVWYMALPLLTRSQAAVVQLSVPVIAAVAGVVFLSEQLSTSFIVTSAIILGAVFSFLKAGKGS